MNLVANMLMIGVFILILYMRSYNFGRARFIPIFVFITTILFGMAQFYILGTDSLSPDELFYISNSEQFGTAVRSFQTPQIDVQLRYIFASYFYGTFYVIFGSDIVPTIIILNSGLYTLSMIFLYYAVISAFPTSHGNRTWMILGLFFIMYPVHAIIAPSHLREPLALVVFSYTVYRLSYTKADLSDILTVLGTGLLFLIRPELAIGVVISVFSFKIMSRAELSKEYVVIGAGLFVLFISTIQNSVSKKFLSVVNSYNDLYLANNLLNYPNARAFKSISDMILSTPKRIFYFLLYPHPWDLKNYLSYLFGATGSINTMIYSADSLYILIILGLGTFALIKMKSQMEARNRPRRILLLLLLLVLLVGYSITVPDISNVRRRLFVIIILIVLITPYTSLYSKNIIITISEE